MKWLSPTRYYYGLAFLGFYAYEVVLGSLRVAGDVLSIHPKLEPAFITIDLLEEWDDLGLLILANLISMTPGTLTVDASEDRKRLHLHCLYAGQPEEIKNEVMPDFERRLARVLK